MDRTDRRSSGMSRACRLWALSAALSIALAWEGMQAPGRQLPVAEPIAMPQARPSPGQEAAATQLKQLADGVAGVLARPLFAPSRRPPAPASKTATGTAPPAAKLPRLTGVIIAPDGDFALFAPAEGKIMVVAKGGRVAGHVVRSIAPNAVVLSGPEGERALRTSFLRVTPHVIPSQQEVSER
jgi:hypothetical protein